VQYYLELLGLRSAFLNALRRGTSFNPGENKFGIVMVFIDGMTMCFSLSAIILLGTRARHSCSARLRQHALMNPSFHGPTLLTLGSDGPEASVQVLLSGALFLVLIAIIYRGRRYPLITDQFTAHAIEEFIQIDVFAPIYPLAGRVNLRVRLDSGHNSRRRDLYLSGALDDLLESRAHIALALGEESQGVSMPVHGCSMTKLVAFGHGGRTAPIREITFDFVADRVGTNLTLRCVAPEVHGRAAPSWHHDLRYP